MEDQIINTDVNEMRKQIGAFATQDRLSLPHSTVSATNTSRDQTHVIIDRHMIGVELLPGQTKNDIEMINTDVERFLTLGKRGHPVKIDAGQREEKPSAAGASGASGGSGGGKGSQRQ